MANFGDDPVNAHALLLIAADYTEAGRELDRAEAAGVEVEDRRPAVADEWAAALTEFVDSRLRVASEA